MNKKRFLKVGLIFAAIAGGVAATSTFAVACSKDSTKPSSVINKIEKVVATNSTGLFLRNISGPRPRNKVNQFYEHETLLEKKFEGSTPEFKYPSWNYNYLKNNEQNVNNDQISFNGKQIDLQKEILEERTPDNKKYSDPEFIKDEISKNQLKKHPYTKYQYETLIENINNVVDATFDIGTSFPGWYSLGLYVPPGEVVEIQLDENTWKDYMVSSEQPFSIEINHNFWDHKYGVAYERGTNKVSTRYPYLKTNFSLSRQNFDPKTRTIKIGSPFGGNLSININRWVVDPFANAANSIKFTVKNVIPTLYYVDGQTTEEDWNKQIEGVKNNTIAPSFDAIFNYGSMSIPFTKADEIGGVNLKNIKYPKQAFKKLNDFLFLSNYFSSRDIDGDIKRLDLQFNSDVWDEAVGWGGGDTLWCDGNTGANSFLIGVDNPDWWTFYSNWLTFHEINHNYEEDQVMFKFIGEKMHGQTNQVTLFNFAMQGDVGRWRNEWNFYGEKNKLKPGYGDIDWIRLANPYSNMAHYIEPYYNKPCLQEDLGGKWTGNTPDEYDLYNMMMNVYGPMGYANYVRWANKNFRNDVDGWTYMKQIESLSKFFGVNLWPAIHKFTNRFWQDHSPLWVDGVNGPDKRWPSIYSNGTTEEKAIIDDLEKKYKTVDFVSNLYAAGTYLYDQTTDSFKYNGDVLPAYEIPPGTDLTMDLDKYIISMNPYFDWENVEVSKPKFGSIRKDQTNSKKLIYTPSTEHITEIDEFDLTIHPTDFQNKEENYVPAYKWKIKIRQNVKSMHFKVSNLLKDQKMWDETEEMFDRAHTENNWLGEWDNHTFDQWTFDDITKKWKKQCLNSTFRFVALEDGEYDFNFTFANCIRIKIDGETVYKEAIPEQSGIKTGNHTIKKTLKKGESILFNIDIITNNNNPYDAPGQLKLDVTRNNEAINFFDNVLSPYVDNLNVEKDYIDYLTNDAYRYKPRELDYSLFGSNTISKLTLSPNYINKFDLIDLKDKRFGSDIIHYAGSNSTNEHSTNIFNDHFNSATNFVTVDQKEYSVWMNFNNPEQIGSIILNKELGYPYLPPDKNNIPTKAIINIIDSQSKEHIAFSDKLGEPFNDAEKPQIIIPLDKTYTDVKTIKLTFINENNNRIQFNRFDFNRHQILRFPKIKEIIDIKNVINSGWTLKQNNPTENLSSFNGVYHSSNKRGSFVEFNVNNANGFGIVGRSNKTDSLFDVYIDNILVTTSNPTDNIMEFNHILFAKTKGLDPKRTYKVRIEQKEDKPLNLDYITLY